MFPPLFSTLPSVCAYLMSTSGLFLPPYLAASTTLIIPSCCGSRSAGCFFSHARQKQLNVGASSLLAGTESPDFCACFRSLFALFWVLLLKQNIPAEPLGWYSRIRSLSSLPPTRCSTDPLSYWGMSHYCECFVCCSAIGFVRCHSITMPWTFALCALGILDYTGLVTKRYSASSFVLTCPFSHGRTWLYDRLKYTLAFICSVRELPGQALPPLTAPENACVVRYELCDESGLLDI